MLPAAAEPGRCGTLGGLPGLRRLLQLLAEELGERFEAFMGARNEQRVAALQPVGVTGPVGPASAPVHGEGVHPRLGLDLERVKRLAVGRGAWGDGELEDDFVRLADRRGEHRMDLLAFLDDPDHLHGAVCDGLRGGGEVKEAPEARGVLHTGCGEKDPALQPVAHLVHLVLDGDHLAGEPRVAVEQGRVGEPDGTSEKFFISIKMSTARSISESSPGGGSVSGASPSGRAPASSLTSATPSGGPCKKRTSPALSTSSGSGSKSQSSSERMAIGRIPVSTGRSTSPRERPSRALSECTLTREGISSASGMSCKSSGGIPRRLTTILAMSTAALPIFSMSWTTWRIPAICSASAGLLAARMARVRMSKTRSLRRSSRWDTSSERSSEL